KEGVLFCPCIHPSHQKQSIVVNRQERRQTGEQTDRQTCEVTDRRGDRRGDRQTGEETDRTGKRQDRKKTGEETDRRGLIAHTSYQPDCDGHMLPPCLAGRSFEETEQKQHQG
ncbi:hypothetical protein J4Q44_G00296790, partial [Coregonus suidteri]